jgi:hypothetical protein
MRWRDDHEWCLKRLKKDLNQDNKNNT